MPHAFVDVTLHIVFSTKNHDPSIEDRFAPELWPYMGGIAKAKGAIPYIINGVHDHVHLLTSLPPNIELERFVGEIKGSSSRWVSKKFERHFAWQRAYSAFSVSRSNIERVRRYVERQQEHHKRVSFRDEVDELLRKHGIEDRR